MMTLSPLLAALAATLALGLGLPTPAWAGPGPGHDHGDAHAATAPAAAALPRFSAVSEDFELVGVLDGRRLTLYLDRAADNAPVRGARLELELAGATRPATPHEDVYELVLDEVPAPGVLAVTASVTVGAQSDLLAGELELPADEHTHGEDGPSRRVIAAAIAIAVAALAIVLVVLRRVRVPRAALGLCLGVAVGLTLAAPALAGPGHDHGDAPATPLANGPQRLPDGSVFLPKPAQRQLGVRTVRTEAAELPRATELPGTVVMDPNAGGRVQPMNAGRLEPGPRGLPEPGQTVRRGEVLAWVVPAAAPLERAAQAAQLAELRAALTLASQRVTRLETLADTVPRKDREAARAEVDSLEARIAALGQGLAAREALVAPVSGVIASATAVAGQVVDARELLFEIVDPARLRIEVLAHDPALAADIGGASLAVGGTRVPLGFVGAARALRGQALPLVFRAEGRALSALAVGQPVRVVVQGRERVRGMPVPAAALLRNAANLPVVWVKTAPERFEPRTVTAVPLDGVTVAVTAGLQPGDRVATQGATLIHQVR
jgi:hypothetical protein